MNDKYKIIGKYFIELVALFVAIFTAIYTYKAYTKNDFENMVKDLDTVLNKSIKKSYHEIFAADVYEKIPKPYFEINKKGNDLNVIFGHTYDSINASFDNYEPGEYMLYKSPYGKVVLSILSRLIEEHLKKIALNSYITVEVFGTTDNLNFIKNINYKGEYGDTITNYYYSYNEKQYKHIQLIKNQTILNNENLAYLRAFSAFSEIKKSREMLIRDWQISTIRYNHSGGKFRKVIVKLCFKQAFSDL